MNKLDFLCDRLPARVEGHESINYRVGDLSSKDDADIALIIGKYLRFGRAL